MTEVTSLQIPYIVKGKCEKFYANKFNNLNGSEPFISSFFKMKNKFLHVNINNIYFAKNNYFFPKQKKS